MPLEVVSNTLQYKTERVISDFEKEKLNLSVYEKQILAQKNKEVTIEKVRDSLNTLTAGSQIVDHVNSTLRHTLQDIEEINVFKIPKKDKLPTKQPQPPSMSPRPPEKQRKLDSRSGRKLIGSEIFREIRENSELKDFDALRHYNMQNDPDVQAIAKGNIELDQAAKECRKMVVKSRFHSDMFENITALNRRRKEYLQKSEDRRIDIYNYPKKLADYTQNPTSHAAIDWAFQSCKYYRNGIENELFGFQSEQQVFSSSEDEDEEEADEDAKKKKKTNNNNNVKQAKGKEAQADGSPRNQRIPRSQKPTPFSAAPSEKMKKSNKTKETSLADTDVSLQLQKQLDELDRTLYKEMLRQNKLSNMQAKRRSVMGSFRGLSSLKSPKRFQKSRGSSSRLSTISMGSEGGERDSDSQSAHTEAESPKSVKRSLTFDESAAGGSRRNSRKLSSAGKKNEEVRLKGMAVLAKSSPSPPRERASETAEGTEKAVVPAKTSPGAAKKEGAGIVSPPTITAEQTPRPEQPESDEEGEGGDEQEDGEDDENDAEEEDEDEFDVSIPLPKKKELPSYLKSDFFAAIPNDPRASILHTNRLSLEVIEEIQQNKQRKLELVEQIVQDIMDKLKARDPRHFRSDDDRPRTKDSQPGNKPSDRSPRRHTSKDKGDEEEEEEEETGLIVNYQSMFQEGSVSSRPAVPGKSTIYFVSSMGAVSSMHNQDQRDYAEQSIPFRESETKTAIIKSKLRDRQAVGYVLNSKQLMEEMKNKLQGQEIVREVEEYMASYSILSQTKNTRKDVERETRKMKEICVERSNEITQKASKFVQSWKDSTGEKEGLLKDEIQYLVDREFKTPNNLRKRQKQFRKFDEEQSSFLQFHIPDSHKLPEMPLHLLAPSPAKKPAERPAASAGEEAQSTFLTQQPHSQHAHARPTALKSPATPATPARQPHPPHQPQQQPHPPSSVERRQTRAAALGRRQSTMPSYDKLPVQLPAGSMISDNKFRYDYANQLETIVRQNEEREKKEESKRVISKLWFIHLLKKLRKYKRSQSVARLPISLFLLLATLKKLIGLNIAISKEVVWSIIERTIQVDEYRSNLVHSILKNLFDAVQIQSEEIYQRLRQRKIEMSPKFLMLLRKERKIAELKKKIEERERRASSQQRRRSSKRHGHATPSSALGSSPPGSAHSPADSLPSSAGAPQQHRPSVDFPERDNLLEQLEQLRNEKDTFDTIEEGDEEEEEEDGEDVVLKEGFDAIDLDSFL